jgi:hypothetical protein
LDKLDAKLTQAVETIQASTTRQTDKSQREYAQLLRTLQTLVENVATHATDLKHATFLKDTSNKLASGARSTELASATSPSVASAGASQIAAAQATNNRRQRQVDADGMKLSHFSKNNFDEYSSAFKQIYASRDATRNQST